ncbi:3-isopropylmalate dehydrogenase [Candidatus Roizmanbacteria bacterium RIFCSPLOWO2_01_FULL_38_12]|uniref:3-isopropylmalate dehydrogenase n=1 Tax=Candidatus Roizmanbacteria bacterium RIFCSPLOWO2_01_FULL_38_12 TaxID=1802061 RepID=A0A1F7IR96_9BACT|nr:MAG: 3-isopropylmalate dehydrogenase [Candidatus Roizmanbacteria bacterium RIFCSPHIGHO2_01_FULL_38_15]OGK35407.1 MAG: 3-isopropylmalate dehydrogenase [Candidatus Roizmanbacteria bacterium RIFCSPHIGHO2_12_FULL_38_13]OGK45883.1 MAG: 3-isopropylmalate dehydrogenase [Candidatus Roizmanbacteria bacterium RIFCSPLOWO2_01_FULL_38_12]
MKKHIALLPGDGVGPEVTTEAVKVLKKIAEKFDHEFIFNEGLVGGAAINKTGNPFPKETEELCLKSDAILFGAIGDPKYDNDPSAKVRPEQGLLKMRKKLGLYANVRPIFTYESLYNKSPLKKEVIKNVDFVVVRELTSGIYFGKPRERRDSGNTAVDTCVYTRYEIERITHTAFKIARGRRNKVTLVDKSNVLETSRFWREIVIEIAKKYPEIELDYLLVDNAAMQIIKRPRDFDVILTENMFGDILSDEASVITGSIGMLPSASIGQKTSLYEPIHGSYPKAAGKNTANPIGTILSAAMMLEYSFGMFDEAEAIREAVKKTLEDGYGTKDIVKDNPLSTSKLGAKICELI